MSNAGLMHPLAVANAAVMLEQELVALQLQVQVSSDMTAFDRAKQKTRGTAVAPMHHFDVGVFDRERAFWMSLTDLAGETVALQAFRYDEIDTHLADWCMTYMIGAYMRRQELMVPAFSKPPAGSVAERLTGRLVYHGELWVSKSVKSRKVSEHFGRLGLIVAMIKWRPDAIWALSSAQMASHGHLTRMGYTILERGFMRWQWASDNVDLVEYLVAVERPSLESMIEDMVATKAGLPREPMPTQP
jgi:hypothetical protein